MCAHTQTEHLNPLDTHSIVTESDSRTRLQKRLQVAEFSPRVCMSQICSSYPLQVFREKYRQAAVWPQMKQMPSTQTNGRSVVVVLRGGVGAAISLLQFPCPVPRSSHAPASHTDDNSSESALSICCPHNDTGILLHILYKLRVHTLKGLLPFPQRSHR